MNFYPPRELPPVKHRQPVARLGWRGALAGLGLGALAGGVVFLESGSLLGFAGAPCCAAIGFFARERAYFMWW